MWITGVLLPLCPSLNKLFKTMINVSTSACFFFVSLLKIMEKKAHKKKWLRQLSLRESKSDQRKADTDS